MQLTTQRRKETGAFYTPKIWADKAVEYLKKVVPNLESLVYYDPCCGEGALLEALNRAGVPKNQLVGSSLEPEDVEIVMGKGFIAWQDDFLTADIKRIRNYFDNACGIENVIVFTNPPFYKIPKGQYESIKKQYCTNDITALFFYRIYKELQPLLLCSFHKMDLMQGSMLRTFREDTGYMDRFLSECGGFLSPSKSWGLRGNFPIAFTISMC